MNTATCLTRRHSVLPNLIHACIHLLVIHLLVIPASNTYLKMLLVPVSMLAVWQLDKTCEVILSHTLILLTVFVSTAVIPTLTSSLSFSNEYMGRGYHTRLSYPVSPVSTCVCIYTYFKYIYIKYKINSIIRAYMYAYAPSPITRILTRVWFNKNSFTNKLCPGCQL